MENLISSRDGLVKVQKQGRDKTHTKTTLLYGTMAGMKDKKALYTEDDSCIAIYRNVCFKNE